MFYLD